MKDSKIIIGIVLASVLVLFGGIFLATRAQKVPTIASSNSVKAQVDETSFSWGTISMKDGKVQKEFTIKNGGSGTLQLINVQTSCMCTEAQVEIDGKLSPFFGMHQNSSWVGEVAPSKTATLSVIFDPAFHGPQGVGQITRLVSLETNDPSLQKLEFTLSADVTN
ncbi:MAG: hypothetical protein A3F04_01405 [Candidatus Chisholmbacteria bacterium RIFCSPHIGHO2_12_FULL_49_9]|uniref:DUF1573 domain-containing protein n=1 Tax=Candidatus Chisholmbacteria bacterium RIFCSPHIGHO2_01_FULL_52_32 TaxID=1797591 RepID=A0A1G1VTW6_9BACT|nr:MAG: hypothetical protein A3F04_01405 [Candidatus Chisholmbacteria bacterium RIFCSPHIGHO2_12_FULL_49_9]OGY18764.1 MAG: hypothetical protein A2786_04695 [Candidatus Chisholmbacteria bacterium RIFCSPHIGHO2_01_FULL_52_32]OGY19866.1 MAG: hypothetical protein A2900_02050 [Candidatus Chisholmbacteria bacterium RIFCSPLOWO2_01_FULL_50_28]